MASSALGSQSIALLQLPSGTLIDFAGTVEPVGWFLCDGRAVSRTTYSSLFSAIGIAYGSGDGSSTFNIPDFRGRFSRYNDNMGTSSGAASRDTGRTHGSAQTDAMQGHWHSINDPGHTHSIPSRNDPNVGTGEPQGTQNNNPFSNSSGSSVTNIGIRSPLTDGTNGTPRTAAETRPINLSCNRLIKF